MTGPLHSKSTTAPALILAAGESKRFWPLSATRHKTLFEIDDASLLERTVVSLSVAGVPKIVVIQSPRELYSTYSKGILPSDVLMTKYGQTEVCFLEQPTAYGQGDAILRAAPYLGDSFFMVQPENINAGEIVLELSQTGKVSDLAVVAARERRDFSLYAVIQNDGNRLRSIVEKPRTSLSPMPLCGIGIYLLKADFLSYIQKFEPNPASLILALDNAANDDQVSVVRSSHEFLPLKYPGHLWDYVRFLGLFRNQSQEHAKLPKMHLAGVGSSRLCKCLVSRECIIDTSARLTNVIIGSGAYLGPRTIAGRCAASCCDLDTVVIGEDASIGSDVTLGPGVRVGAGASIGSGLTVTTDVPDYARV